MPFGANPAETKLRCAPDEVVAVHIDLAVLLALESRDRHASNTTSIECLDGYRLRHVPVARRAVLDRRVRANLEFHRHRAPSQRRRGNVVIPPLVSQRLGCIAPNRAPQPTPCGDNVNHRRCPATAGTAPPPSPWTAAHPVEGCKFAVALYMLSPSSPSPPITPHCSSSHGTFPR